MKNSALRIPHSALENWLPDMDLNHDKQIQSLLCYRYTIGQAGASDRLKGFASQSRLVKRLNCYIVEPGRAPSDVDSTIQPFSGLTIPYH